MQVETLNILSTSVKKSRFLQYMIYKYRIFIYILYVRPEKGRTSNTNNVGSRSLYVSTAVGNEFC
jgi:hypothetical protein